MAGAEERMLYCGAGTDIFPLIRYPEIKNFTYVDREPWSIEWSRDYEEIDGLRLRAQMGRPFKRRLEDRLNSHFEILESSVVADRFWTYKVKNKRTGVVQNLLYITNILLPEISPEDQMKPLDEIEDYDTNLTRGILNMMRRCTILYINNYLPAFHLIKALKIDTAYTGRQTYKGGLTTVTTYLIYKTIYDETGGITGRIDFDLKSPHLGYVPFSHTKFDSSGLASYCFMFNRDGELCCHTKEHLYDEFLEEYENMTVANFDEMIALGFDINHIFNDGRTPFMRIYYESDNRKALIRYMLKQPELDLDKGRIIDGCGDEASIFMNIIDDYDEVYDDDAFVLDILKRLTDEQVQSYEKDGNSIIMYLCCQDFDNDNLDLLKYAINRFGIEINKQNNDGETVLYIACRTGLDKCVEHLYENYENIIDITLATDAEDDVFSCACRRASELEVGETERDNYVRIIRYLLDKHSEFRDTYGDMLEEIEEIE